MNLNVVIVRSSSEATGKRTLACKDADDATAAEDTDNDHKDGTKSFSNSFNGLLSKNATKLINDSFRVFRIGHVIEIDLEMLGLKSSSSNMVNEHNLELTVWWEKKSMVDVVVLGDGMVVIEEFSLMFVIPEDQIYIFIASSNFHAIVELILGLSDFIGTDVVFWNNCGWTRLSVT